MIQIHLVHSSLLVNRLGHSFKFPLPLFIAGIKKTRSVLLELPWVKEDIVWKTSKLFYMAILLLSKNNKSVIVEFLPQSKWMTLNDKNLFSDPNSLITTWSQILVRELIGKEKVFKPFWNEQCKEKSLRLWLPIETDYVGLHSSYWNTSLRSMESNSWFWIKKLINPQNQNLQMISYLSSISTPVEQWEKEDIITRKIRIYPTPPQRKLLKQWMGTRRYVYNKVLSAIKNDKENINFMDLRNKHVTARNNETLKAWEREVPKDIRAGAIRDLVKNYMTAFSLLKKGNITHFQMSYCKKKDTPSIEIPKSAIQWDKKKGFSIYKTYPLGDIKASKKQSKKDYTEINHDCRLLFKNNLWHIVIPLKRKRERTAHIRKKICSLDPGITTFQTVYSPDRIYKFQRDPVVLKQLQIKLDKMQSLRGKKYIGKQHYKRREKKLYQRQENLIDDLHYKTAKKLTFEFQIILLPIFENQKMVKKGKRICRNLLQLKHFLFQQRLKEQCLQSELRICTEEYTSKTCGWCGKVNILKNYDVYECLECHIKIDRDINGARNIFIKNMP